MAMYSKLNIHTHYSGSVVIGCESCHVYQLRRTHPFNHILTALSTFTTNDVTLDAFFSTLSANDLFKWHMLICFLWWMRLIT